MKRQWWKWMKRHFGFGPLRWSVQGNGGNGSDKDEELKGDRFTSHLLRSRPYPGQRGGRIIF